MHFIRKTNFIGLLLEALRLTGAVRLTRWGASSAEQAGRWPAAKRVVTARACGDVLCMLFNACEVSAEFCLPAAPIGAWHRVLDTSLLAPDDITFPAALPPIADAVRYPMGAHAFAMPCAA